MPNLTQKQMLGWGTSIAVAVVVAVFSYAAQQVLGRFDDLAASISTVQKTVEHNNDVLSARVAAIELWKAETAGNRFTSADGAALLARITDMQREIAAIPKVVPPLWVSEDLKSIKAEVMENGKAIAKLEAAVANMRIKS